MASTTNIDQRIVATFLDVESSGVCLRLCLDLEDYVLFQRSLGIFFSERQFTGDSKMDCYCLIMQNVLCGGRMIDQVTYLKKAKDLGSLLFMKADNIGLMEMNCEGNCRLF